jgi:hypothetical protein
MRSWIVPLTLTAITSSAQAAPLPVVEKVEFQPMVAQAQRLMEALIAAGSPLPAATKAAIESAKDASAIQKALDPHCLAGITINPEQRVKAAMGPALPVLDENGWRVFVVKVANEAGTTAELKVESPHAATIYKKSTGSPSPPQNLKSEELFQKWMDVAFVNRQPMRAELSGLEVEYRLMQIYCADRSLGSSPGSGGRTGPFKREAKLSFNVGQGTQDLGFRSDLDALFTCQPSKAVKIRVVDEDGKPTTAAFEFRDGAGRVYPAQVKRLAPDFFFHPQVYRQDGETVDVPAGDYTVDVTRGPEYLAQKIALSVPAKSAGATLDVRLKRWIDPAKSGWISGDHHIHAAGCAHYEDPTQGVSPKDMVRHAHGEDLKVGCALTWGPCFYFQKRYFTGTTDKLSTDRYLLRYDLEISGWSSHRSGHLVLLRLKDQEYPGTKVLEEWPNLGLSILKWARAQGAVTGPAHSGWGMAVPGTELPNYNIPPYDGIGANEFIMQITHQVPGPDGQLVPAVNFISTVDTPYVYELNPWYHTLNAGFRVRASGETDFPCIYGQRVGLGRVYVKMDNTKKLDYDRWVAGLADGRSYVSDGKSHVMDFKVNGLEVGTRGSELKLDTAGSVTVTAKVAALLPTTPNAEIKKLPYTSKPFWDLERARIGDARRVPLELVVNGVAVARKDVDADGVTCCSRT